MGENSHIAWTDHTHNPWWGCQRVSPGCTACYAEAFAKWTRPGHWGPPSTTPRFEMSEAHWKKPLKWNREALDRYGRPARVFTGSMCDLFEDHPQLPPLRERQWELIEATPNLEWLLLTKRIENVMNMVPTSWAMGGFPSHVRIGCTVEDNQRAEERIPELLEIPCPNFVSYEPALELVDFDSWTWLYEGPHGRGIEWLIIGGESKQPGSQPRPFDVAWARKTIQDCQAAGVPVFMKQLGSNPVGWCVGRLGAPGEEYDDDFCDLYEASEIRTPCSGRCHYLRSTAGSDPSEWPESLRIQEFPPQEEVSHGIPR